jgi:DNA glycosylase AlkZ-like
VGGIQAQYAPSMYVGLWSRLAGFERDDLTRALERRSVAQGTLMRVTIHLVSARDFPVLAEGVRERRREGWMKAHSARADRRKIEAAAKKTRKLLAEGPRRRSELAEELGADSVTWNGVGMWLDLVRAPPSGTWEQRRADLYALAEDWLGPSEATTEQGLELLVRRYLSGFGPGSLKDLANWAGLPPALLKPVVEGLKLRRFRDERGGELIDLPRAPLPDPDTPAPVRFLPVWDATLLAHARRTQILPEQYRTRVFSTKTPQSANTFLIDGRVAGTWKYDRRRVAVEPFERLAREVRREVDEEAARLTEFHAEG